MTVPEPRPLHLGSRQIVRLHPDANQRPLASWGWSPSFLCYHDLTFHGSGLALCLYSRTYARTSYQKGRILRASRRGLAQRYGRR